MQRFHFISKHRNNIHFIDMNKFWDSIKKNNLSNSQNLFSPFSDKLDLFYICLLVGLKNEIKDQSENYELSDITDKWTLNLKNTKASDYIIGFYLSKLTKNNKDDKAKINTQLNSVLDHNSDTKLSEDGLKELHEYAFGGYNKILEELDGSIPSTLVKFFDTIYKLIK
jgi:ribosomal protein S2